MGKCNKCNVNEINTNSGMCKLCKKEYMKKYYLENKEKFSNVHIRECQRKRYIKNRERILETQKIYNKTIGYKCEKTPKQRKIRVIKRLTRRHFPLCGQKCILCNRKAEHRHHTTEPIQYDKFEFLCKSCHVDIHKNKLEDKKWLKKTE